MREKGEEELHTLAPSITIGKKNILHSKRGKGKSGVMQLVIQENDEDLLHLGRWKKEASVFFRRQGKRTETIFLFQRWDSCAQRQER